jgi:predicted CxxxxCH...CXXCH cytochrome family protein
VKRIPVVLAAIVGCSVARSPPDQATGVHPAGWARREKDGGVQVNDPAFHGTWLAANHFPLSQCQACHGNDYLGVPVGVSCSQASCHSTPDGPLACTTCHHDDATPATPRPTTGAHQAHALYCDTCHKVPQEPADVPSHASGDSSTLVRFSGLATNAGAAPSWDPATKRCANTYCHGSLSPPWIDDPPQIGCDGCHARPPASHAQWTRVATGCAACHPTPSDPLAPVPSDPRHLDGVLEMSATCTACHGANDHAWPPLSLDGSTDPATRGVGAHQRHLDGSVSDRISEPVACTTCHPVPQSVTQPGHYGVPQTPVSLPAGGAYDPGSMSCTVWCHWNKAAGAGGPVWTNASGSARACDGCHDFPPTTTRSGLTHPNVAPFLQVCEGCHPFGPQTHVDGVVELAP